MKFIAKNARAIAVGIAAGCIPLLALGLASQQPLLFLVGCAFLAFVIAAKVTEQQFRD